MPPGHPAVSLVLLAAVLGGCKPDLEAPLSIISSARVIAVKAEPPEASPATAVTYRALVVSGAGEIASPALQWSHCLSPKPLTENNVVSTACLTASGQPFGDPSGTATAPIPTEACRLFGPDVPPAIAGEPPFRPRDPDITGGYYQPVRVELEGQVSFAMERLRATSPAPPSTWPWSTADATPRTETRRCRPSRRQSTVAPWRSISSRRPAHDARRGLVGRVRRDIPRLRCSERRAGRAPRVDARVVVCDAGEFETEHCGSTEDDLALQCVTVWTAPAVPGRVQFWVVLRDCRGGFDFASLATTVARP